MKVVAAILAAGRGERFGSDKTQVPLHGKPLWRWSFDAFSSHPEVDAVGLVGSESNIEALRGVRPLFAVLGGRDRQSSSRIAVEAIPDDTDVVLLHDAARPFVSPRIISDVIAAVQRSGAAAPGIPVTDTVKRVGAGRVETLDRSGLFTVQTPQGAKRNLLYQAHREATGQVTDDLALMEAIGVVPEIVAGDPANRKVTQPEDLDPHRARLSEVRTGQGYDVHAFSPDSSRRLFLGGVEFEGETGLDGHSDADVVLHAAVDALLGAAGLGDIGQHFPNNDPKWKNAPSTLFLRHASKLLQESGWTLQNIDITVVAERPKVMTLAESIRSHIASALEIDPSRVNLKATTNERLGFIGRGEGIAALATATISRF